jgi:hypothetical protein
VQEMRLLYKDGMISQAECIETKSRQRAHQGAAKGQRKGKGTRKRGAGRQTPDARRQTLDAGRVSSLPQLPPSYNTIEQASSSVVVNPAIGCDAFAMTTACMVRMVRFFGLQPPRAAAAAATGQSPGHRGSLPLSFRRAHVIAAIATTPPRCSRGSSTGFNIKRIHLRIRPSIKYFHLEPRLLCSRPTPTELH